MPTSDSTDGTKQGQGLPLTKTSEAMIREAAPAALNVLKNWFGSPPDIIDALGLRPYTKD